MEPSDLHDQVERAFNDGDIDALVALYEPDARMVRDDGTSAVGAEEIREVWAGLAALGGRIALETRYAIEQGEVALIGNTWTFTLDGTTASATTAEVVRRQPDGTWRYLIDNPYAGDVSLP